MDARDYPEAYLENELESYGTSNHLLDKAAKEIKRLRESDSSWAMAWNKQQKELIKLRLYEALVAEHGLSIFPDLADLQAKLAMAKAVLIDIESSAVAHPAFSGDTFDEVEHAGGDTAFVTHDIALRATNALALLEDK